MNLKYFATAAAIVALITALTFVGIYEDREFFEPYVFVKHRPSTDFMFRSPVGEADRLIEELPDDERQQESLFREFVEDHGGWHRSIHLFALLLASTILAATAAGITGLVVWIRRARRA